MPSPHAYQAYSATHLSPPVTYSNFHRQPSDAHTRSSFASFHSIQSHQSPMSSSADFDEEGEKGRCPHPDCGRVFKDLKAHMITHRPERPEKCPILNCEYNQKGFARKY